MPFYFERNRRTKLKELRVRFPSVTAVQRMAGEGNVLCDMKLVITLLDNARTASRGGGDAVFDNKVGMLVDGATSKGMAVQGATLDFANGESVTMGMVATVSETSVAKAQIGGNLFGRHRELAEAMEKAELTLPVDGLARPSGPLAAGEAAAVSILSLVAMTSDRCAAERGQCNELQKLKAQELPLLLGRRFRSAGMGVSLRLVALAPERCLVEAKVWLQDGSAAQAFIAAQQLPQLLTAAVNDLLAELPDEPAVWLERRLSSGGGGQGSGPGRAGRGRGRGGRERGRGGHGGSRGESSSTSTEFSAEIDRYLWRHKVAACLEAIVNQVVGGATVGAATTPLSEAFLAAFGLDAQQLQVGPWVAQPDGGGDDADIGDARDDAPADEQEQTDAERDLAQQIGEWKVAGLSSRQLDLLTCIVWTNCHEQALVNTFEAMLSI